MWTFEHAETTTASPAALWARYADPTRWPEWDQGIAEISVDGPFAVGTRGRLKPVGGPASRFRFVRVDVERGFTDVTSLPLARLRFDHEIEAMPDGGSRFTHRMTITGLLSPLFAKVIGKDIATEMPKAMRALADLAVADESQPARS